MAGVLDGGPCFRWFTWAWPPSAGDLDSVADAFDAVEELIEDHGPFDGVLGFSQGASLAAGYIAHCAVARPLESLPFRFAVLFSCSGLPELDGGGADSDTGAGSSAKKLSLPSLHVCGEADDEWLPRSRALVEQRCERGSAALVMHKGGHVIPKDRPTVDRICREVERLLHRAMVL